MSLFIYIATVATFLHQVGWALYANESEMFDYHEQQCCNGTVHDRKRGWSCCGNDYFNPQEMACCHNQVVPYPNPLDDRYGCCFDHEGKASSFDPEQQQCCTGQVIDKPDPDIAFYGCCNGSLFNESTETCCGGHVVAYDPEFICCAGEQLPLGPNSLCCGGQVLVDTTTQLCCQSVDIDEKQLLFAVHSGSFDEMQCCGLEAINITENLCCFREPFKESYSLPRPPLLSTASHGRHHQAVRCCGEQIITNMTAEFCCGDVVHPRTDGVHACCGHNQPYNPLEHMCCGQQLYDRNEHFFKICCVATGELFDPNTEQCCGDRVVAYTDDDKQNNRNQCCAPFQSAPSQPMPAFFENIQVIVNA